MIENDILSYVYVDWNKSELNMSECKTSDPCTTSFHNSKFHFQTFVLKHNSKMRLIGFTFVCIVLMASPLNAMNCEVRCEKSPSHKPFVINQDAVAKRCYSRRPGKWISICGTKGAKHCRKNCRFLQPLNRNLDTQIGHKDHFDEKQYDDIW